MVQTIHGIENGNGEKIKTEKDINIKKGVINAIAIVIVVHLILLDLVLDIGTEEIKEDQIIITGGGEDLGLDLDLEAKQILIGEAIGIEEDKDQDQITTETKNIRI